MTAPLPNQTVPTGVRVGRLRLTRSADEPPIVVPVHFTRAGRMVLADVDPTIGAPLDLSAFVDVTLLVGDAPRSVASG